MLERATHHLYQLTQFANLVMADALVHRKPVDEKILEDPTGPDTEFRTALALHAIAHRDDDIKVIHHCFIALYTCFTHMCKFCTCALLIEFSFFINIADVTANDCSVFLKQLCHLCLSQPHRILVQTHIDCRLAIIRFIYDNLVRYHKPNGISSYFPTQRYNILPTTAKESEMFSASTTLPVILNCSALTLQTNHTNMYSNICLIKRSSYFFLQIHDLNSIIALKTLQIYKNIEIQLPQGCSSPEQ